MTVVNLYLSSGFSLKIKRVYLTLCSKSHANVGIKSQNAAKFVFRVIINVK